MGERRAERGERREERGVNFSAGTSNGGAAGVAGDKQSAAKRHCQLRGVCCLVATETRCDGGESSRRWSRESLSRRGKKNMVENFFDGKRCLVPGRASKGVINPGQSARGTVDGSAVRGSLRDQAHAGRDDPAPVVRERPCGCRPALTRTPRSKTIRRSRTSEAACPYQKQQAADTGAESRIAPA